MEFSTGKGDQASEELSLVDVTRVDTQAHYPLYMMKSFPQLLQYL